MNRYQISEVYQTLHRHTCAGWALGFATGLAVARLLGWL